MWLPQNVFIQYSYFGLVLGGSTPITVFGYADASYITDGDAKSRFGVCIFLNCDSGAILSFSRNDTSIGTISHSVIEVEIEAVDQLILELIYLMDLLNFLEIESQTSIYIL